MTPDSSQHSPSQSPSQSEERPPSWLRRSARWLLLGAAAILLLVAARGVLRPFVLGVLLAYVLAPVVGRLARTLPRWLALLSVYIGLFTVIGATAWGFGPRLSADFARLFREAPSFFTKVRQHYVPAADAWLEAHFPREESSDEAEPRPERKLTLKPRHNGEYEISLEGMELEVVQSGRGRWVIGPRSDADDRRPRLADLLGRAASSTETEMKGVLVVGQRFLTSIFKGFAWFVLTFMVAAYLLVDIDRVLQFFRNLIPLRRRSLYDELVAEIDRGLSGVIRGQLLICVVNGSLTTIGLFVLKVKYSLLLGALAGLMSFIPVFGSILSSVPIVVVALASGTDGLSFSKGFGTLGWIVGIHLLEANVLNPKIIGTAAKIHPVVVVFALMVGEELGGLSGAVLAVPVASVVQTLFLVLRPRRAEPEALPEAPSPPSG